MQLKTFRITDVAHKTVIIRVDFNIPLTKQGTIADDRRIIIALETIKFILLHQAKVVLISHLGRPKKKDDRYSLKPIAEYLKQKYRLPISFIPELTGKKTVSAIEQLKPSQAVLLENLRFHPGETKNDLEFAADLASLGDVYINDAFSTAHRAHASTVGITRFLPSLAGLAFTQEFYTLSELMDNPRYPLVIILGGAKISDKVGAIQHLAKKASIVLVGGAVANNFLKADGFETYQSFIEENSSKNNQAATVDIKKAHTDYVKFARHLMKEHQTEKMLKDGYFPLPKILYPIDVIAAPSTETSDKSKVEIIDLTHDPAIDDKDRQLMYLDIGPKTTKLYKEILQDAKTIFWNGPMGVWENPLFSSGTKGVAQTIAKNTGTTVLGGGDTIAAVRHFGLENSYQYVSAAGGAALDFLSGKVLPGIKPLLLAKE